MRKSKQITRVDTAGPDLFLSYNHGDIEAVLAVQRQLQERGVSTFLDSNLPLGLPWHVSLYNAIQEVRAVAVFIGKAGLGNWQMREVSVSLDRQIREERSANQFPVIPVLLPEAKLEEDFGFLLLNSWVDLRGGLEVAGAFDALTHAIRRMSGSRGFRGKHKTSERQTYGDNHKHFE